VLLAGNKRFAGQSLTVFLAINDLYLDAPEQSALEMRMAVITMERTVNDQAPFIETYMKSNI